MMTMIYVSFANDELNKTMTKSIELFVFHLTFSQFNYL